MALSSGTSIYIGLTLVSKLCLLRSDVLMSALDAIKDYVRLCYLVRLHMRVFRIFESPISKVRAVHV